MSKYLLLKNLLTPNGEVSRGDTIELDADDPKTARLLEKGTIVEATEGVEVTPQTSAFETAKAETEARNAVAFKEHNEQQAREAEIRAEEEAKKADQEATATPDPLEAAVEEAVASVETPVEPTPPNPQPVPTTEQPSVASVQPSPEQIQQDALAEGVPKNTTVDVQIG